MWRLLLTVESAGDPFRMGLGAQLTPWLSYDQEPHSRPESVLLKLPDGTTRMASIGYGSVHLNLPYEERGKPFPWMTICYLKGIAPEEVQPSTEVWYDDGLPPEHAGAEGYEGQRT